MQGRLPFAATGGLQAAVSVEGLDVRKAAAAFGFEFPIEGALTADWNAAGTWAAPELTGGLALTNVAIAGEPFDRLAADAAYGKNGFVLRDALLTRGEAELRAAAAFAPAGKEFEFRSPPRTGRSRNSHSCAGRELRRRARRDSTCKAGAGKGRSASCCVR